MQDLTQAAIQASLHSNWEEAIDLNIQILHSEPESVAALNRLARAYTELNQKDSAKEVYEKVLKIDKFNPIALKSLRTLPNKNGQSELQLADEDFIEESGVTKAVRLTKLATKEVLLTLTCKQPLHLSPRARLVSVITKDGTYIGSLPDDLSVRLNKLLKLGYSYSACVKSNSENSLTLFLRETKRPNRTTASPTFSPNLKHKELKRKP